MINKYTIVGTLGILIFSSGLCVFGEALIRKFQNLDLFYHKGIVLEKAKLLQLKWTGQKT